MAVEFNSEFFTYQTPDGKISAGDFFYFYEVGTSTKKTIYADSGQTTPIDNPAKTNSRGQLPQIFIDGAYRVERINSNEVPLQESDPVGGDAVKAPWSAWNVALSYNAGEIALGSNGNYYISLTNNNIGNDPITPSPSDWTEIRVIFVYNSLQTFSIGQISQTTNGNLWKSVTNNNIGNDPTTDDGTEWLPAIDVDLILTPTNTVIPHTGASALVALRKNEVQDSGPFTIPLANTVLANQTLEIEFPDKFSAFVPVCNRTGADTISFSSGTDTSITFRSTGTIKLISDGVSDWRI